MERSLGEEHWARDFEDAELFEREVGAELWDRHFDDLAARGRPGRDARPPVWRPPPPPPPMVLVTPPTPPNTPAPHRKWKREALYDALVARMDSIIDELD